MARKPGGIPTGFPCCLKYQGAVSPLTCTSQQYLACCQITPIASAKMKNLGTDHVISVLFFSPRPVTHSMTLAHGLELALSTLNPKLLEGQLVRGGIFSPCVVFSTPRSMGDGNCMQLFVSSFFSSAGCIRTKDPEGALSNKRNVFSRGVFDL